MLKIGKETLRKSERKATYEELQKALEDALEHLDYCGWGDRWENGCSEGLQKELPEVLRRSRLQE